MPESGPPADLQSSSGPWEPGRGAVEHRPSTRLAWIGLRSFLWLPVVVTLVEYGLVAVGVIQIGAVPSVESPDPKSFGLPQSLGSILGAGGLGAVVVAILLTRRERTRPGEKHLAAVAIGLIVVWGAVVSLHVIDPAGLLAWLYD